VRSPSPPPTWWWPLVGVAFAAPVCAYSVHVRTDQTFAVIFRLVMLPLFLFSGTFFPVSELPSALRYLATPCPCGTVCSCRATSMPATSTGPPTWGTWPTWWPSSAAGALLARHSYRRRMAR